MALNLTMSLICTGHAERAIGAFQAQLELNFCRPRHLNSPPEAANDGSLRDAAVDAKRQWTKQVLDELEEFWDGEASRVGETGGHGWDCQDREGEATVPTTVQSRELKSMSDVGKPESTDQHPVARWLSLERSSAQKRCMPTRTTDEPDWEAGETEIDPYATVLFSDIRPLLFILHTEQGKQHLVASLLEYMGVPTGSSPESAMGITALGRLADSVALQNCFWPSSLKTENGQEGSIEPPTWDVINGEVMERERDSGLADPFKCPLKAFPASPDTLVAPALPQSSGSWFTLVDRKDVASSDVSLIRLVRQVEPKSVLVLCSLTPPYDVAFLVLSWTTCRLVSWVLPFGCFTWRLRLPKAIKSASRSIHFLTQLLTSYVSCQYQCFQACPAPTRRASTGPCTMGWIC